MSETSKNPAVVLALTATGLAVARSLHRSGVAVYGVDAKTWEVGHHSREVRHPPFRYGKAGPELAEAIVDWARGQPAPPVLIPADDPYVEFLSVNHARLREHTLLPEGYRPEVASTLVNKTSFYRRAMEIGIELPVTLFPEGLDDLAEQSRELRFPAILKPAHGHLWRKRFKGQKVLRVESREELLRAFGSLGDLQTGMTVQEVIPGPEREIFVCGAYFGTDGSPRALFTARKSRQYPPGFGSGSLLRSEWSEAIAERTVHLATSMGYRGICGTEYKPDPRDGGWKLIELNPRPTLWFSLCRAAGCDVVLQAYLDLVGRPRSAEVGSQRDGVLWQYSARDMLSLGHYLRRREAGWSEILEAVTPWHKDEAIASFRDLPATLYYPLYGFRQWRAHSRGEDTGP